MRKLVSSTFVSLDGVMQAPGGPQEDGSGGFSLGGWTVPCFDEGVGAFMDGLMGHPFDLVLGRRTYDVFAGYWPTASAEEGAQPLNDAVKHVASRGTPQLTWERSELLTGDVAEAVAGLKQQDGPELQVHGSGDLLQTLWGAGLVDEVRLLTFPVLLGSGKRLFEGGAAPTGFELVESSVSGTGVVMACYRAAGPPRTGTFGS